MRFITFNDDEQQSVRATLVIGGRDSEASALSLRLHPGVPQDAKLKTVGIADTPATIRERGDAYWTL